MATGIGSSGQFVGVGTMWGELNEVDGAVYAPIRGRVVDCQERPAHNAKDMTEAIITLEIDEKVVPVFPLDWEKPDMEAIL